MQRMRKIRKKSFAIIAAMPAATQKPKIAAAKAMTRKVTAYLSI